MEEQAAPSQVKRPQPYQTTIALDGEEYAVELSLLGSEPTAAFVPLDRYRVLIKHGTHLFRRTKPWLAPHETELKDIAAAAVIQLRNPNSDNEWRLVC